MDPSPHTASAVTVDRVTMHNNNNLYSPFIYVSKQQEKQTERKKKKN